MRKRPFSTNVCCIPNDSGRRGAAEIGVENANHTQRARIIAAQEIRGIFPLVAFDRYHRYPESEARPDGRVPLKFAKL